LYSLPTATTRESSPPLQGEPAEFFSELRYHRERFLEAMHDDFNTGGAVGVLFELRKSINAFITQSGLEGGKRDDTATAALTAAMTQLKELANLLGVFREPIEHAAGADDELVGQLMELIIDVRGLARQSKQFHLADRIRDGLNELNIALEDRPEGTSWRRN
ncbi:MAG: DALR domain-containing protein, partial [Planctomycetaceae bacterium]